jgi:Domain of unknown function (DUF4406)
MSRTHGHNQPSVYIAGPMDSVGGNFNFPLFDHIAERLRASGCFVFSPADHAREVLGPEEKIFAMDKATIRAVRKTLLKYELGWIIDNADFVLMLPGWESSRGATAERTVALAVDIPVRECPNTVLPVDSWRKEWEKLQLEDSR